MMSIDDYNEVKECIYKEETYSARDNGAVLRHQRKGVRKRKLDEVWSFGTPNIATGYMDFCGERVHRIVATAFLGPAPSEQHVVDHIDTNRQNNRPENLRWLTKLENILNNEITRKKVELMRRFYEVWKDIETNSVARTTERTEFNDSEQSPNSVVSTTELQKADSEADSIRQLRLTSDDSFPITAFLNISFTHHVAIFRYAKEYDERKYYIQIAYQNRMKVDDLEQAIKNRVYDHRNALPNNFFRTIPDSQLALRTIQTFKDSYLLDYINVEDIDESDPINVDERVIESKIVMNIKNFIMTFGKSFTYKGHQVHYDKLGHDHWIDLLFFNRELQALVVVELKKGQFKPSYLGQLAAYLRILDDDERLPGENPSVGIILCKKADKAYVEYVLQDYVKPMGVATYKNVQNRLRELLPPEDEMKRLMLKEERKDEE